MIDSSSFKLWHLVQVSFDSYNQALVSSNLQWSLILRASSSESSPIICNMVYSKAEINLKRLLVCASRQQTQRKLVHYVATLRELLEAVKNEMDAEGSSRLSSAKFNEYSAEIEALAAQIAPSASVPDVLGVDRHYIEDSDPPSETEAPSAGLRRRFARALSHGVGYVKSKTYEASENDASGIAKLDAAAEAHIEKHRKLQEDLTDEMVGLARQLKDSNLLMSYSLQGTEKLVDSTEMAIEQSLSSTTGANALATEVYSTSSRTSCFTWLMMFVMLCIFVIVVLLIRVT